MSLPDIDAFLTRAASLRVLVVGDLMLDEYLWGKTERISPEAPVQVVEVERDELRLGGAGNVINNLTALGCEVQVASVLGDDGDGRLLRSLLPGAGDRHRWHFPCPGADHQPQDPGPGQPPADAAHRPREQHPAGMPSRRRSCSTICAAPPTPSSVILVSDYLKGVLSAKVLATLCELGRARGIPVVVDPKGRDFSRYRGATVLTPNRQRGADRRRHRDRR